MVGTMLGTDETQLEMDKSDPFPGGASSIRRGSDTHRGNLYSNKVRPDQRCTPPAVGGSHHGSHKSYPEV